MSAESDLLLHKGLEELESGDRQRAAQVFVGMLRQDPQIEEAWWWLTACVDNEQQKRDCLQRVLELNPWNEDARNALDQLDFNLPDPLPLAQSAEATRDYEAAYHYYTQATELNASTVTAWFGKGFSAGMLSTPGRTGVREFFECLGKGLRASGITTSDLRGVSVAVLAERLSSNQLQKLAAYLRTLYDYVTVLAERCSPDMSNIYHVERVYLADWIQFIQALLKTNEDEVFSRERMLFIAGDAFTHIAANVHKSTRAAHARQEMLGTFKFFLMTNLGLSKLNQDAEMISLLDDIAARFY